MICIYIFYVKNIINKENNEQEKKSGKAQLEMEHTQTSVNNIANRRMVLLINLIIDLFFAK